MTKQTLNLDTSDAKVKKLNVGDKVTVTVQGTVKGLEASRRTPFMDEDEPAWPANVTIEVGSMKLDQSEASTNEFTRMAEEDLKETM